MIQIQEMAQGTCTSYQFIDILPITQFIDIKCYLCAISIQLNHKIYSSYSILYMSSLSIFSSNTNTQILVYNILGFIIASRIFLGRL